MQHEDLTQDEFTNDKILWGSDDEREADYLIKVTLFITRPAANVEEALELGIDFATGLRSCDYFGEPSGDRLDRFVIATDDPTDGIETVVEVTMK